MLGMKTLMFRGKSQSVLAWSRELGIPVSTIYSRLEKLGLSAEEALTRPVDGRFRPTPKQSHVSAPKPAPRLQRDERGRGIARWTENGHRRKRVFGPWGKRETVQAYSQWAAEWHVNQGHAAATPKDEISVAALVIRCVDWAEEHYQKNGKRTSEASGLRASLAVVNELYGECPIGEFGPVQLLAVQARWVKDGLAVQTCNGYLTRVKRCFSFGVSRGLVPAAVADALMHVPSLVAGRSAAAVPEPVKSAPDEHITAVLPHLHKNPERRRILEAVVRLQRLTGMRPGEVLELRAEDIDRTRTPWLYRPPSGGKTLHFEKERKVWIGPAGREMLGPWLDAAETGEPVFRLPSRKSEGYLPVPIRIEFLRWCLLKACEKVGVPAFTPNQIRHTRATEIHERYESDEAVAAALGNSPEVARQVYVDSPADRVAQRIAEATG